MQALTGVDVDMRVLLALLISLGMRQLRVLDVPLIASLIDATVANVGVSRHFDFFLG